MTAQDDLDNLRTALQDLAYTILEAVGIVRLTERLGMKPRPWAVEARKRAHPDDQGHSDPGDETA